MSDEPNQKQHELRRIQEELKQGRLSRRGFLDSMKALGVGFGAAFVLGIKDSDALPGQDSEVSVKSANPAVDEVIKDAQFPDPAGRRQEGEFQLAYRRVYRRFYRRGYRRYGRGYRRFYNRFYGRGYRRGFRRVYRRVYRRF
jgi:hypothetical protein